MSYSLLEWFSVISLILNFSRLLLIKAGLNRLKLIKATGWHKFNLSRLFSNPGMWGSVVFVCLWCRLWVCLGPGRESKCAFRCAFQLPESHVFEFVIFYHTLVLRALCDVSLYVCLDAVSCCHRTIGGHKAASNSNHPRTSFPCIKYVTRVVFYNQPHRNLSNQSFTAAPAV